MYSACAPSPSPNAHPEAPAQGNAAAGRRRPGFLPAGFPRRKTLAFGVMETPTILTSKERKAGNRCLHVFPSPYSLPAQNTARGHPKLLRKQSWRGMTRGRDAAAHTSGCRRRADPAQAGCCLKTRQNSESPEGPSRSQLAGWKGKKKNKGILERGKLGKERERTRVNSPRGTQRAFQVSPPNPGRTFLEILR